MASPRLAAQGEGEQEHRKMKTTGAETKRSREWQSLCKGKRREIEKSMQGTWAEDRSGRQADKRREVGAG